MSFWGPVAQSVLGGALGGLLGGQQKLPPELRRLYKMQYAIARQLRQFAGSAPMSDPLERAGLAGEQAQLGEQQRMQRDQMYAMLGPSAVSAPQDVVGGLASQQVGQRMALSSQHLLNALAARRAALPQAAGVAAQAAGSTAGMRAQQPLDLASMFGQLAQQYSMQRAMRPQGVATPTVAAPRGTQQGWYSSTAPGYQSPGGFDPFKLGGTGVSF